MSESPSGSLAETLKSTVCGALVAAVGVAETESMLGAWLPVNVTSVIVPSLMLVQ